MNEQSQQVLDKVDETVDAEGKEKSPEQKPEGAVENEGEQAPAKTPEEIAEEKRKNQDSAWKRVIRKNARLEAERDIYKELAMKQQDSGGDTVEQKPTLDQFGGDVEKFTDALTEYKINKKLSEELPKHIPPTPRRNSTEISTQLEENRKKYPDFDEVIDESKTIQANKATIQAIKTSDIEPELRYYLVKNPDIMDRLSEMDDIGAVREIGRIEARIEAENKAKIKPAQENKPLPKPINPEKGKGGTPNTDLSTDELFKKFSKRT